MFVDTGMQSSVENTSNNITVDVIPDYSKNNKITDFGHASFKESYLLEGENPQDLYLRVARKYGSNPAHVERLYTAMSNHWFSPATPILSNGGTNRGLPISCFLNGIKDDLHSIISSWSEIAWLGAKGGGVGSYWGDLREVGSEVGKVGKTSGAISFLRVQEAITSTINQGSLRRSSAAVYLRIDHPEVNEFIGIRKPGGDPRRKVIDLHNGLMITNAFMEAVISGSDYDLISPKNKKVVGKANAREIWMKIIDTRIATGEPYLVFEDAVHAATPETHKKLGLYAKSSNLCSEIVLPIGEDHLGNDRTAVCCLSSLNLETWDEWKTTTQLILDVLEMLDNVLQDFIDTAEQISPFFAKAVYAASRERSVGLGVMGLHSLFQSKGIAFESAVAKSLNIKIFKHIRKEVDLASNVLSIQRGPCPDSVDAGTCERFVYKSAIAPTASISILCGNTSPGIEPIFSNVFNHKMTAGQFTVWNKYLLKCLEKHGQNNAEVRRDILQHGGSVQHLDFLTEQEKMVFKAALELDQNWLVELAADRAPYIDQSQSVNLFFRPDEEIQVVSKVHLRAWKKGVKSLYYCRSKSLLRSENSTHDSATVNVAPVDTAAFETPNDGECLACQ